MDSPLTEWQRTLYEKQCHHEANVLTYSDKSNGVRTYRWQCTGCGCNLGFAPKSTLSAEQQAEAVPFDHTIGQRYHQMLTERYRQLIDFKTKDYQSHLASPEWQELRRKVFRRCKGVCEGCLERPAVEVHHLTYARLGDEMLFDLVGVCSSCHDRIHPRRETTR